ncbi:PQQ-binding-like beta-propeller repeat protein [Cellulomonas sp. NPDC057328]|uniref:outer membrane protein assembly factor BamB family protein n=1 Tax=Cellulomonas sp. NPDC057328 TaxID=3346101 RepID=UPI00364549CF
MTGLRPAARMQLVELADTDDEDAPAPAGADPRRGGTDVPGRRPGRWGVPRWWPAALAAVVVLAGAVVATQVVTRAAAARADAIAGLPGFVRPLDAPPGELWRAPAAGRTGVLAAGGHVLAVSDATGTWEVRAHDPRTGEARWGAELVETSAAGFDAVAVSCPPGTARSTVVLCRWTQPRVVYSRTRETVASVPPTRVVALDAADGSRLGGWDVADPLVGARRVADDLVVATVQPDGRVLVERRTGAAGEVLWSHRSADVLVTPGSGRVDPALSVVGGVVVLGGEATTVLDAASGGVVAHGAAGRQLVVAPLPDGRFATWAPVGGAHLHDRDGSRGVRVPGVPVRLAADDGSVEVLLTDLGNRVAALDPEDGATVWELATSHSPVATVDGAVVLWGDAALAVVDARDGTPLWEHRTGEAMPFAPVTDGRLVLAAEPDGADRWALSARGLHDGVRVWSVPLPAGVTSLEGVGGTLVARTETDAVVLG